MQRNWTIRLVTFVLWLLAAGSAVYWALKWVSGSSAPAYAVAVGAAVGLPAGGVDGSAVAKALGGGLIAMNSEAAQAVSKPVSSIVASRFVLTGVVDSPSSRRSDMALIAMDGKPARPYRLGAALEAGVVLQSVQERKAVIGPDDGTAGVTLELPPRAAIAGVTTQPAPVSGTLLSRGTPSPAPNLAPAPMAIPSGAAVAPLTPIGVPPPVVVPPNPAGANAIDPAQAAATAANVQALERMGANRKQRASEAAPQPSAP